AMRPTPMPHRPKKWRRVSARNRRSSSVMALFPRHEIVQIEKYARDFGPRSKFRNLGGLQFRCVALSAAGRRVVDLFLDDHPAGLSRIGAILVALERQESCQALALHIHRFASNNQQERVIDALGVPRL